MGEKIFIVLLSIALICVIYATRTSAQFYNISYQSPYASITSSTCNPYSPFCRPGLQGPDDPNSSGYGMFSGMGLSSPMSFQYGGGSMMGMYGMLGSGIGGGMMGLYAGGTGSTPPSGLYGMYGMYGMLGSGIGGGMMGLYAGGVGSTPPSGLYGMYGMYGMLGSGSGLTMPTSNYPPYMGVGSPGGMMGMYGMYGGGLGIGQGSSSSLYNFPIGPSYPVYGNIPTPPAPPSY